MEKVKIKMTPVQFAFIASVIEDMDLRQIKETTNGKNLINNQMMYAAFKELGDLMFDVVSKYRDLVNTNSSKKVSKAIPHSYALLFFAAFYGRSHGESFAGVSFKEMCRQIEQQLFIKGPYKFPQKGAHNG
jgi:uncharacterized protein (DUF927 family)